MCFPTISVLVGKYLSKGLARDWELLWKPDLMIVRIPQKSASQ